MISPSGNEEKYMLVLTRNIGEAIFINNKKIIFRILEAKGKQVKIGIEAPVGCNISREEVFERSEKQKNIANQNKYKEHYVNGTKVVYK